MVSDLCDFPERKFLLEGSFTLTPAYQLKKKKKKDFKAASF